MIAALSPIFLFLLFYHKEMKEYKLSSKNKQLIIVISILTTIIMTVLQVQWYSIVFSNILILSSLIDIKHREIPDIATVIGLLIVLSQYILYPQTPPLFHIVVAFVIYSIFFLSTWLGHLGGGDNKILLPIILSLMQNFMGLSTFIFVLPIFSVICFVPQMIRSRKLNIEIPLAPVFTLAFIATVIIWRH